jgi:hypothetical protein
MGEFEVVCIVVMPFRRTIRGKQTEDEGSSVPKHDWRIFRYVLRVDLLLKREHNPFVFVLASSRVGRVGGGLLS